MHLFIKNHLMHLFIKNYVLITDWICEKVGRITMYLVFVMMFILILSFVNRQLNIFHSGIRA